MRTELKRGERKVLELREHWFVLVKPLLGLGFFLLMVIFIISAGSEDKIVGNIFLLIFLLGTLVNAIAFLYKVFDRKFNIWAVTNLRVINEYGYFSHGAKESPLEKINNISYQHSFLGQIFNYGDVQIRTAAEMGTTTFKFVTSPKLLKDTITKYQDEYRQTQIAEQAQKLAQAIKGEQEPEADTKECPYCAEVIKAKAKVCRFCGKVLE